jgi:hypothetical protein
VLVLGPALALSACTNPMIPFSGRSVAASSAQVAGLLSVLRLPVDLVRPSVPRSAEQWAALSLCHRRLGTATNRQPNRTRPHGVRCKAAPVLPQDERAC